MKQYTNFINGEWTSPTNNEFKEVENPTTEETIAHVAYSSNEDVDQAVEAAKSAFPAWNKLSLEERTSYVEKLLAEIKAHKDELRDIIVEEFGAAKTFSESGQVGLAIDEMSATIEAIKDYDLTDQVGNTKVIKEGYGVVAAITPWNYPLNQIQRKITPALLAVNTVVVKPASDTPLTAVKLFELAEKVGFPKGVFNLILGSGSGVGNYLAEHKDVAVVSFTGSTEVGQGLYENAAKGIKHIILELGGKSALVYLPGGDLSFAVKKAMGTILNNQGQTCTALTRLLVPKDELADVEAEVKSYYEKNVILGDPADPNTLVGPMVSANQKQTVLEYIEKGKAEGAKVLVGDKKPASETGHFVTPTVFTNVTNDMTIAQEEIFGPVLAIITYETEEEAIEIANDSIYGLSGAVVGPDERAYEVAKQLRTGNIFVNKAGRNPLAPFGGYKQSGLGRENGLYGVEDYLETKAIFLED